MFLIKGYYFIFWVFIHTVVGLCETINWVRHPKKNLMSALQQNKLRSLGSYLQVNDKYQKDRPAQWRHRPIPAYSK